MRLFVAVTLDAAVIEAARTLASVLSKRAQKLAPKARITWVAPDVMHLTVRFIGEVEDARVDAIRAALGPSVPEAPFLLTLGGAGVFPPHGAPRVAWAGIEAGMDELRRVEQVVSSRLAAMGIPPEDRPFNPHLTLGRIRDAAGLRARPWLASLESTSLGTSRVDAITLYESRPSPKGPLYSPLLRSPLTPA